MESLELKHLAPYLPYRLKVKSIDIFEGDPIFEMGTESKNGLLSSAGIKWVLEDNFKPILRPMSDLTELIEIDGQKIIPIDYLNQGNLSVDESFLPVLEGDSEDGFWYENYSTDCGGYSIHSVSFKFTLSVYEKLLEWHFDVFGLIDKGLAIDINKLKK